MDCAAHASKDIYVFEGMYDLCYSTLLSAVVPISQLSLFPPDPLCKHR